MRKLKNIVPGDNLTLRVPIDTDQRIIDYINRDDFPEKRNKHLTNLLFTIIEQQIDIENKIDSSSDEITIKIPGGIEKSKKDELITTVEKMLFILSNHSVNNKEKRMKTTEEDLEHESEPELDIETASQFSGFLLFDDEVNKIEE